MKTLFILITAVLFSMHVYADGDPNKYCTLLKDGKLIVMHRENILTSAVTLANGMKVRPDATVLKKDGTIIYLQEGECIDTDGKISIENSTKKRTREKF